jgi:hypothetical protein
VIQCCHVHVNTCGSSSITEHYNRIKEKRGSNKIAIVAAARKQTHEGNLRYAEGRKKEPSGWMAERMTE